MGGGCVRDVRDSIGRFNLITGETTINSLKHSGATPATTNRWLVILGAILIQLCLGSIFAWSVFTKALEREPFGFSKTKTVVIYSVGVGCFSLFVLIGSRWHGRLSPAWTVRIGGCLLAAAYVLAHYAGTSFATLMVSIGVIGGAGIGAGYAVPISVCMKWFPDRKGFITGICLAGFGFGSLLWIQLASSWKIGSLRWVGLMERYGVSDVFFIYGIVFFVLVLLGSLWIRNPPPGWSPEGWSPPATGPAASGAIQFNPAEMLATWQFWTLWYMYICGLMAGHMVIGIIKLFGMDALQARSGLDEKTAESLAATAMGVFFSIANGSGRILWGMISDFIGRKAAMVVLLGSQAVILVGLFFMAGYPVTLFAGVAMVGFNFGGTLSLFAAVTADYFGNSNFGRNYGWMFTAAGVGGIAGPLTAALFAESRRGAGVDAWFPAFVIVGAACLIASGIGLALRPPKMRTAG